MEFVICTAVRSKFKVDATLRQARLKNSWKVNTSLDSCDSASHGTWTNKKVRVSKVFSTEREPTQNWNEEFVALFLRPLPFWNDAQQIFMSAIKKDKLAAVAFPVVSRTKNIFCESQRDSSRTSRNTIPPWKNAASKELFPNMKKRKSKEKPKPLQLSCSIVPFQIIVLICACLSISIAFVAGSLCKRRIWTNQRRKSGLDPAVRAGIWRLHNHTTDQKIRDRRWKWSLYHCEWKIWMSGIYSLKELQEMECRWISLFSPAPHGWCFLTIQTIQRATTHLWRSTRSEEPKVFICCPLHERNQLFLKMQFIMISKIPRWENEPIPVMA